MRVRRMFGFLLSLGTLLAAASNLAACQNAPPDPKREDYVTPTCASPGDRVTVHISHVDGCKRVQLVWNDQRPVDANYKQHPVAGVDVYGPVPEGAPGTFSVAAKCIEYDDTYDNAFSETQYIQVPCPAEAGVPDSPPEASPETSTPKKPMGSIEISVSVGQEGYATSELLEPVTKTQEDAINAFELARTNHLLQPAVGVGACGPLAAWAPPTPSTASHLYPGENIRLSVAGGGGDLFVLVRDSSGNYNDSKPIELPTAPRLDLLIPSVPTLPGAMPGLAALEVRSPKLGSASVEYDPETDFVIDAVVPGGAITNVIFSGRTEFVCKLDLTVPRIVVPRSRMAEFTSGTIQFRQVQVSTVTFPFRGVQRELVLRSVTGRIASLVKKPKPL